MKCTCQSSRRTHVYPLRSYYEMRFLGPPIFTCIDKCLRESFLEQKKYPFWGSLNYIGWRPWTVAAVQRDSTICRYIPWKCTLAYLYHCCHFANNLSSTREWLFTGGLQKPPPKHQKCRSYFGGLETPHVKDTLFHNSIWDACFPWFNALICNQSTSNIS